MPPKRAKLTAAEREAEKAARAARRQEERRLTSGEAALEHITTHIDEDAWDEKYVQKFVRAGITGSSQVVKARLPASGAVTFTLHVHHADVIDKEVKTTHHAPAIAALVIKKPVLNKLKHAASDFVQAACAALNCRVVVLFENALGALGEVGVTVLTHANIVSVTATPSAARTGEILASLACYVARAPYKPHVLAPKIFSEDLPPLVFQRMLSHIPSVGPLAVAAIATAYPTAACLLARYHAAPDASDARRLLEDLSTTGGPGRVGPAVSEAVYDAFVLGSLQHAAEP